MRKFAGSRTAMIILILCVNLIIQTISYAAGSGAPAPDDRFSPSRIAAGIKAGVSLDRGLAGGKGADGYYEFNGTGIEKVEYFRYGMYEEEGFNRPYWADEAVVGAYAREGFNAVRFHVFFGPYMKNDTHKMDKAILDAVEEYVNIILDQGMYAIFTVAGYEGGTYVGSHYESDWAKDEYAGYVDARFSALWTQAAERFKNYDERVIFEAVNEPHMGLDRFDLEKEEDLTKLVEELTKLINRMNAIFVDAVRKTGGNNEKRLLLLCELFDKPQYRLSKLALPDDRHIGVAPHYYECAFWPGWSRDDDWARGSVDAIFDGMDEFITKTGIPIIITEGAIMSAMPYEDRLDLADYSAERLAELGIPWCWFEIDDDGGVPEDLRCMLYHWREQRWLLPEIRDILLKYVKQAKPPDDAPPAGPDNSTPSNPSQSGGVNNDGGAKPGVSGSTSAGGPGGSKAIIGGSDAGTLNGSGGGINADKKDKKTVPGDGKSIFESSNETLTHIRYISGYPDGGVKPDSAITRAEASIMLYRVLSDMGIDADAGGDREPAYAFPDAEGDAWYVAAVSYIAGKGYVLGYPDGAFKPESSITRAEFAAILARIASEGNSSPDEPGENYSPDEPGGGFGSYPNIGPDSGPESSPSIAVYNGSAGRFGDITDGHWAGGYISVCSAKGWMTGYPDGTFKPDNYITRAEAITTVNRAFDRKADLIGIPGAAPSFHDLPISHWAYADVTEAAVAHDFIRNENGFEIWQSFYFSKG